MDIMGTIASMDIKGYSPKLTDIHGYPWASMAIHGY